MSGYERIMVGYDHSPGGTAAVARAVELARTYHARLFISHVIEHFPEDEPLNPVPENRDPETALVKRARNEIEQLRRTHHWEEAEIQVTTSTHSAKRALLEQVERSRADLLVIGGAGEAGVFGVGSTASSIVHSAPCDVLVVRGARG